MRKEERQKIIQKHGFFKRFWNQEMSSTAILCNNLLHEFLKSKKDTKTAMDNYFKKCTPDKEHYRIKRLRLATIQSLNNEPDLEIIKIENEYKFAIYSFNQFLFPIEKKHLKTPEVTGVIMSFFLNPEKYIEKK